MNDNILLMKKEIRRLYCVKKLTREEKYDLIVKQWEHMEDKEKDILLHEYQRDLKSYESLKYIKEIITLFLTGVGIVISWSGAFFTSKEMSEMQFAEILILITLYTIISVLILMCVDIFRRWNVNRIEYVIDTVKSKVSDKRETIDVDEVKEDGI